MHPDQPAILVVGVKSESGRTCTRALTRLGHIVLPAVDAADAIAFLQLVRVDLIVAADSWSDRIRAHVLTCAQRWNRKVSLLELAPGSTMNVVHAVAGVLFSSPGFRKPGRVEVPHVA